MRSKKISYRVLTKIALMLHGFFYKLSSRLAVKTEGGVHPKHRLMNYHKFFVDNISRTDVVLDIGCGNGALTYDLAKKANMVVGIDLNKKNIQIAKTRYSASNIEYRVEDAVIYLPDRNFDVVVLSNVLEHIKNRKEFLEKIKTLAPKILIRVPMINRDWITLYKKELGIEYRLDKTHFIEYTLENFKEELRKVGLRLDKFSIQFGEIWASVRK